MPKIHVDALVYEEDGVMVAHALQLDIVATGSTIKQAVDELIEACQAQIGYAIENNNMKNLFRPAPPEIWEQFLAAKQRAIQKKRSAPKRKAKNSGIFSPRYETLAVPA